MGGFSRVRPETVGTQTSSVTRTYDAANRLEYAINASCHLTGKNGPQALTQDGPTVLTQNGPVALTQNGPGGAGRQNS
jgi:hypothetical protein